jgi:hypothetical protein
MYLWGFLTPPAAAAVLRADDLAASCLRGALPEGRMRDNSRGHWRVQTSSRLAGGLLGTGHWIIWWLVVGRVQVGLVVWSRSIYTRTRRVA